MGEPRQSTGVPDDQNNSPKSTDTARPEKSKGQLWREKDSLLRAPEKVKGSADTESIECDNKIYTEKYSQFVYETNEIINELKNEEKGLPAVKDVVLKVLDTPLTRIQGIGRWYQQLLLRRTSLLGQLIYSQSEPGDGGLVDQVQQAVNLAQKAAHLFEQFIDESQHHPYSRVKAQDAIFSVYTCLEEVLELLEKP
ncbi:MAG: hypothetical protein WCI67_00710 [Chloroflexales bacterium]